ncbi:hypothetical protein TPA0910_50370 [Streptomyces hygroscopicus subsp. sporocinereus]|uniref:Uncharacterized protein n=1 Tax=Streptomyces hygroscopicus TaxID=1912 RepID=A0ABQ3U4R5_STRHY|nr:hypothetical protein TPA0910_50370 [Streptomyces hygroscopicus]
MGTAAAAGATARLTAIRPDGPDRRAGPAAGRMVRDRGPETGRMDRTHGPDVWPGRPDAWPGRPGPGGRAKARGPGGTDRKARAAARKTGRASGDQGPEDQRTKGPGGRGPGPWAPAEALDRAPLPYPWPPAGAPGPLPGPLAPGPPEASL